MTSTERTPRARASRISAAPAPRPKYSGAANSASRCAPVIPMKAAALPSARGHHERQALYRLDCVGFIKFDAAFGEEVVRRAHGAFPEFGKLRDKRIAPLSFFVQRKFFWHFAFSSFAAARGLL